MPAQCAPHVLERSSSPGLSDAAAQQRRMGLLSPHHTPWPRALRATAGNGSLLLQSISATQHCSPLAHRAALGLAAHAAGDWWETRGTLPVEPLNAVLGELSTWTEAGLPMLMLVGNHDQAGPWLRTR